MQNTPEFLGFYPWYDTENKYEGVLNHMGAFASNILKYVSCAVLVGMMAVCAVLPFEAYADTYSDLVAAQNSHASSVQREQALREQLKGVQSDLLEQVVELDKLTNTQIPVAQEKAAAANDAAAQAQSEADAAADRLDAARKDEQDLKEKIAQTGADYDDSHAAVASMARESLHGSNTADAMAVVTGAKSTKEFVSAMQTRDALARTEANAAAADADDLNVSMNRGERLKAIEQRIAKLKADADTKAAAALSAASEAQDVRDSLDALRVQGENRRAELESKQDQLQSDAAKQAVQTVLLQSKIDDANRQYAQQQADAAGSANPGQSAPQPAKPGNSASSGNMTPQQPSNPVQPSQPSQPSVSTTGQGTHNGDYGNMYPAGQCTWYAYNRRAEMGIGTPSYLHNGGEWYLTAPAYGLRVDHNPQVGAAISFLPGQDGADGSYGHVAVVEAVYGDGTFLISEMNWGGPFLMHSRVLVNRGQYWFVH